MKPIAGQPILNAAQMRVAEAAAAPNFEALYGLMERAGAGVADAVRRMAAGSRVLVVCGPGNNGGDGYVAARILREQGVAVSVAESAPPRTELALRAAAAWGQASRPLGQATAAPIVVDALFGTGLSRKIDREVMIAFDYLAQAARFRIAVDLPSGLDADSPRFNMDCDVTPPPPHLTLALGALKPVHVMPGAHDTCGDIRLIDIGLDLAHWPVRVIDRPGPPALGPDDHKYRRGMVGVISGEMPGAALLTAAAAARAGAGYVVLFGGEAGSGPASLVHRPLSEEALSDERLSAVIVGPGLGRGKEARRWLEFLVGRHRLPLVIDADALHLIDPAAIGERHASTVLTPHHFEYEALLKRIGSERDPEVDIITQSIRDLAAFNVNGMVTMVRKGFTTYVVNRQRVWVNPRANPWLSTAGTGDVLAGAIGAMLALYVNRGQAGVDAAAAGVWLHTRAAERLGASFIADDLAHELSAARCLL